MNPALIPADLLQKSNKILFIAHLALGDFTYLQNCFKAFRQAYPHLQIHLWVDELRRTADAAQWPHLKKYSLYDWTASCNCFDKVYSETYSPQLYQQSLDAARREQYPLIVSLATLRPQQYAGLAREISPDGFVVGIRNPVKFYQFHHLLGYAKMDAAIARPVVDRSNPEHISDVYADWFRQAFGLEIAPAARFPFVDIPQQWLDDAQRQLAAWDFAGRSGKLVFINPFAKANKRCWPLERVAELIAAMQKESRWADACFIVNAVPQELANARRVVESYRLARTELFSAEENFFQLPAMLKQCDLIVSVETAVMHLANAVHVPVVALMRQKNPEWVPVDRAHSTVITAPGRNDWVKAITVEQVMRAIP
jgi:ADP-heptose:LPS heptosyltransferase